MSVLVTNRESFEQMWHGILDPGGGVVRCSELEGVAKLLEGAATRLVVIDVGDSSIAAHDAKILAELVKQARVLLGGQAFSVDGELSALAVGVAGCCSPSLSAAELSTVVEVVLKGGIWVSRDALPILLGRLQGLAVARIQPISEKSDGRCFEKGWSQLTPREREIASRVARGETNKVIARHLDISDATIKAHLTSVFQKLKVSGRLQLALLLSGRETPSSVETS